MTDTLFKLEEKVKQAKKSIKLMETNGGCSKEIKKLHRNDIKRLEKLKRK